MPRQVKLARKDSVWLYSCYTALMQLQAVRYVGFLDRSACSHGRLNILKIERFSGDSARSLAQAPWTNGRRYRSLSKALPDTALTFPAKGATSPGFGRRRDNATSSCVFQSTDRSQGFHRMFSPATSLEGDAPYCGDSRWPCDILKPDYRRRIRSTSRALYAETSRRFFPPTICFLFGDCSNMCAELGFRWPTPIRTPLTQTGGR